MPAPDRRTTGSPTLCVGVLGVPAAADLQALARSAPDAALVVAHPPGADLPPLPDEAVAVAADGAAPGALAAAAAGAVLTADVALVLAGTPLPTGWSDALSAAADAPLAALAVALTLDAVPGGGAKLDQSDAVGHPRVPTSAAPAALVTRAALEVVGPPDASLTTWPAVLTDLIQRATLVGLTAVAAGDLVLEPAPGDAGAELAERYPWLAALADEAARAASPPARAAAIARRALHGLQVTLDLRSLGPLRMGTQTHALGLALALADTGAADLRLLVAHDLDPDVAARLTAEGRTTLLRYEDAVAGAPPTAIVHRPQQVNTADDLALLQPLGERLVVTHQDLIAYRNPGYHAGVEPWLQHRRMTRYALQMADRVLFFTGHARDDAVAEDLLDPAWADVVGIGVDVDEPVEGARERPSAVPDDDQDGSGLLVCLGTDLRHKHRPFALDLLRALRDEHGWNGRLVLAGPQLPLGGTSAEEDERLAADPALAERVIRLAAVPEAQKRWLLAHATLVIYPTIDEGFGLMPFEAAAAGTPCAWAPTGALPEVLPTAQALLVPWDAHASASRVAEVLRDPAAAQRHVADVRADGRAHRWRDTAEQVLAAYEHALATPRSGVAWEARDRATVTFDLDRLLPHVAALEREVPPLRAFYEAVGEDGARLVGPHGMLSDADRRALLSVIARPALRGPFLAALRLGYRLGRGT